MNITTESNQTSPLPLTTFSITRLSTGSNRPGSSGSPLSPPGNDDTPIPARTDSEEEPAEGAARSRIPEEHAVEDAWYQVLRRKHVEEIEDAEGA